MAGWQIKGEYMETCNCTLLCPCIWSNLAARPTEGDCKAAVTLRIDKGAKDGVTLVIVTHERRISSVAKRVIAMRDGMIVETSDEALAAAGGHGPA